MPARFFYLLPYSELQRDVTPFDFLYKSVKLMIARHRAVFLTRGKIRNIYEKAATASEYR